MDIQNSAPFQLFDNIINGALRPHLLENRQMLFIENQYKQAISATIESHQGIRTEISSVQLRGSGPYIRHQDIIGEKTELKSIVSKTGKTILLLPIKGWGNYLVAIVPLPTSLVGAYYLFLIEREHHSIMEYLDSSQVEKKKLLIELLQQAKNYNTYLRSIGYQDNERDSPLYVIHSLVYYLKRELNTFLDNLIPIWGEIDSKSKPLKLYVHFAMPTQWHKLTNHKQVYQEGKTLKKKKISNTSWHQLFKSEEVAEFVLQKLRDEKFITAGGRWQRRPFQSYMVALYEVLRDREYLRTLDNSAEELNDLFNRQFSTNFTHKQWQPNKRYSAKIDDLKENFNIIPDYPPPLKKP